jgi:hypothetical protein
MTACLSDDVVFNSPVAFKPFVGRAAVRAVLAAVLDTFSDFVYVDELSSPEGTHALIFRARVGERSVEGLDHLRTGPDGLVRELTVMLRPLSAVIAMAEAMGPKVDGIDKGP